MARFLCTLGAYDFAPHLGDAWSLHLSHGSLHMKFSCEKCNTRYSIADEKVQGKVLKIRCKNCSHVMNVRGPQKPAAASIDDAGATRVQDQAGLNQMLDKLNADSAGEWYVAIKGQQHGPMDVAAVVALLTEGRITPRSYLWSENLDNWKRMREVPAFASAVADFNLKAAAPASPPPAPPPAGAGDFFAGQPEQTLESASSATIDPFAAVSANDANIEATAQNRESTRVFIMRAGLQNRKKKHRMYGLIAGLGTLGFVGALALDWYGVVEIPGLHSAVTFAAEKAGVEAPKTRRLAGWDDGEGGSEAERCKLLGNCKPKPTKRRRPRASGVGGGVNLNGAFETGGPGSNDIGRAGVGGAAGIELASNTAEADRIRGLLGGGKGMAPKKSHIKFDKNVKIEAAAGSQLDPKNIRSVVERGQGSVAQCLNAAIKRGESAKGKKVLVLTLAPKGVVQRARFTDPVTNASQLGKCVIGAARKWKFAPFAGQPTEIEIPMILTTGL